jgi:hypothetical protein
VGVRVEDKYEGLPKHDTLTLASVRGKKENFLGGVAFRCVKCLIERRPLRGRPREGDLLCMAIC